MEHYIENYGIRKFAKGIEVSNDTFETGLNNNDLIIGGSGSAKTGSYVFNLLLNPCGSMVISDCKGLLHKRFEEYLKNLGYEVYFLDFVNPENNLYGYNPLDYICNEKDINKIANDIVPILDRNDPFWEKAATRYISMLLGFVKEAMEDDFKNMGTVLKLHRQCLYHNGKKLWLFPNSWLTEQNFECII